MARGRLIWPGTVIVVAAILATGGVLTARALAPQSTPSIHSASAVSTSRSASGPQTYLASCTGSGLVKPRGYTLACADGGIWLSGLTWSSWTSNGAVGSGKFGENNCVPDCAQGTPVYDAAQVVLSNVVTRSGRWFFGSLLVVTKAWSHSYDVAPLQVGAWTSSQLTITSDSLGAVRVGMTIAQASAVAGERLVEVGDGYLYPGSIRSNSGLEAFAFNSPAITCVFASQASGSPSVVTDRGFHLGGSFAELQQTYGASLKYVPAPATGPAPQPGYIVRFANGNLVFWVSNGIVTSIGAGLGAMPSSCDGHGLT